MLFWGVLVIYLSEGEENNGFIFDNLLNYKKKKQCPVTRKMITLSELLGI